MKVIKRNTYHIVAKLLWTYRCWWRVVKIVNFSEPIDNQSTRSGQMMIIVHVRDTLATGTGYR